MAAGIERSIEVPVRDMSRREWHLACEISIQALATKSFQNQKTGQDRTRFMFLVPRSMQIMVISGTNQSGNAGAEKRPKRELLYAKETSAFKGCSLFLARFNSCCGILG